jgi:hypothetical protein
MPDRVPSRLARLARSLGRLSTPLLAVVGISLFTGAGEPGGRVAHPRVAVLAAPQVPPDFTHSEHEAVQCYECHDTRDQHAELLVTTIQDCRACHHAAPRAAPCSRCHTAAEAPTETFEAVRAVAFTVGTRDPSRALEFPHPAHAQIDCARCHTEGVALAAPANLDCSGCHQDHHTAQSDCASCHGVAPVEAHPPTEAHVTCSGSACHQTVPFQTVPRTRDFCLGCHQDMREHEAPRACAECHALPAPRPQGIGLQ